MFVGMEVRVQEAELAVSDDGVATDVFKLTNLQGTPLSESKAREVVERVRDFVMFCGSSTGKTAVEWKSGNILVSNQAGPNSRITIVEAQKRIGALYVPIAD
jgi:hypothetical protein